MEEITPFAMAKRFEVLRMFHKRELDDLPNDVQQVIPNTTYQLSTKMDIPLILEKTIINKLFNLELL